MQGSWWECWGRPWQWQAAAILAGCGRPGERLRATSVWRRMLSRPVRQAAGCRPVGTGGGAVRLEVVTCQTRSVLHARTQQLMDIWLINTAIFVPYTFNCIILLQAAENIGHESFAQGCYSRGVIEIQFPLVCIKPFNATARDFELRYLSGLQRRELEVRPVERHGPPQLLHRGPIRCACCSSRLWRRWRGGQLRGCRRELSIQQQLLQEFDPPHELLLQPALALGRHPLDRPARGGDRDGVKCRYDDAALPQELVSLLFDTSRIRIFNLLL